MLNILIPCAGSGKRFREAGYAVPKPLIPINKVPMILEVMDNVFPPNHDHRFIVISMMGDGVADILDGAAVRIALPRPTSGAAETCLKAAYRIDNDDELLICNCDQLVDGGIEPLLETDGDAAILTMEKHDDPRWSYVTTECNEVVAVYEKQPVSDRATTGHYWWRRGRDFVKAATDMIERDDRVNGEFYVAPVFNHFDGVIREVKVESYGGVFHGLGTPEDLNAYLDTLPEKSS